MGEAERNGQKPCPRESVKTAASCLLLVEVK